MRDGRSILMQGLEVILLAERADMETTISELDPFQPGGQRGIVSMELPANMVGHALRRRDQMFEWLELGGDQ